MVGETRHGLPDTVTLYSGWIACRAPGECTNLCRVYNLIMVSRVPGYGHLEYLVLGLSCESHHHVTLINFVGLMMITLIGIEDAVNHS